MGDEKDAFYVVRKGDVIGVYKNLSDLQALLRTSIGEPAISVFKGYRLTKESEEYLASHGLKNAMYSMDFSDVRDDLFGTLIPCPFRQPGSSKDKIVGKNVQEKRMQMELVASPSFAAAGQQKLAKLDNFLEAPPISSYPILSAHSRTLLKLESISAHSVQKCRGVRVLTWKNNFVNRCLQSPYMQCSCILEFDGASKGNPGLAGAGAVLRAADGSMVFRLREGVGVATNNVAEYRGVILGLRYALEKGFKHIKVKGDSKLVCMQTQGIWKCKNQNMAELSKIVKELKDQFMSFQINHMDRESNTEADAQANLAVYLKSKGLLSWDVIAVYKNLSDLQALLRSSVGEPAISVYKGYHLAKQSEEYLASHGLKNAMYSMDFSDVRDDLFGILVPCPFRQPGSSKDKIMGKNLPEKRMQMEVVASPSFSAAGQQKHATLDNCLEIPPISSYCPPYIQCSCILEFDGASKGNPGPAGAGAVLRAADGSMVFRLREGVGVATNNVAEYRGVILGLKYALEKGFKHVKVKGDSKLVCMQTQGIWKCKNQNMAELSKIVKELKDHFVSFQINHIYRVWPTFSSFANSELTEPVYQNFDL
uniref:RNase H type-1 domain-containing protein n=1 Tax=Solanum lycopersicum TaxID=4081 RepID=A0A3Q7FAH7_SOLLC